MDVGPIGVPGEEIGSVNADEVNEVSGYLKVSSIATACPRSCWWCTSYEEMIEAKEALVGPPTSPWSSTPTLRHQANKVAKYRALRPRDQELPLALFSRGLRPDVPSKCSAPRDFVVYEQRPPAAKVRERLRLLATIGPCAPLTH